MTPWIAFWVAVLLPAAGCALSPTPYRPLGDTGGYEETRLQERVFRVSFRGNRATAETDVLDFLYLRCAEVTRQSGYTHFVVQEDFGRTQLTVRHSGPRSSIAVGVGGASRRGHGSFWGLGFAAPLNEPEYESAVSYHLAVFVIRMLTPEEAREPHDREAYDAEYLIRSLEPKKAASLQRS